MRRISGYDLPWQDDEVRLPWWRRALNWLDTVSFAYRNADGPRPTFEDRERLSPADQRAMQAHLDEHERLYLRRNGGGDAWDNAYRYQNRSGWSN